MDVNDWPSGLRTICFLLTTDVLAGNSEDIPFSRPADLDILQSTPFKPLALKTPPRVISLSDRPLDFLDLEKPPQQTPQSEEASTYFAFSIDEKHSTKESEMTSDFSAVVQINLVLTYVGKIQKYFY